jgi:hypothetical protein
VSGYQKDRAHTQNEWTYDFKINSEVMRMGWERLTL